MLLILSGLIILNRRGRPKRQYLSIQTIFYETNIFLAPINKISYKYNT